MQYQYYILKGIGPEGIRLKPDSFDDSQGDGNIWHDGTQVRSLYSPPRISNNYMLVNVVNARSQGYIHMKHLDPLPQTQTHQQYAPPPGPPPPPRYTTVMSNLPKYPIAYQDSVTLNWYAVGPDGKSYWLNGLNGGSHRRKHRRSCKKRLQKSRSRSRSRSRTKSIFKK